VISANLGPGVQPCCPRAPLLPFAIRSASLQYQKMLLDFTIGPSLSRQLRCTDFGVKSQRIMIFPAGTESAPYFEALVATSCKIMPNIGLLELSKKSKGLWPGCAFHLPRMASLSKDQVQKAARHSSSDDEKIVR
jgi:hypothetical protein